jgi:cell division transport system permease protein
MRALSYFFDEAAASVVRGLKTALLATATIAVAFIVLGGFLILTRNLERVFTEWQSAAEFSVYLAETSTQDHRTAIQRTIEASGLAAATEAVSKEEALRRFRANFSALADATSALPSNPLPASIEVRLRRGAAPADVAAFAQKVAALPGVADVRYDRQWIERLMRSLDIVRTGGLTLVALLVGAAALTVASVVRLALVARQEEIHIMQLVGAPLTYIRGPFIVEGFIQGGVGALVAIVALWIGFIVVRSRAISLLGGAVDPGSLVFLSFSSAVGLLAAGMAVGATGGFIAARQTREVADEIR